MRCAQAATARMAKGLSVGGPGDSEDNCVERNAIRTIRVGEMESGSYRAETSVVRNVTTTRFYTVVRLDFHRVSGATSRLPGFLDGVPYLKRTVRPAVGGRRAGARGAAGSPASEKARNPKPTQY